MSLKRENGAGEKSHLCEGDVASLIEEKVRWLDEDRHKRISRSLLVLR